MPLSVLSWNLRCFREASVEVMPAAVLDILIKRDLMFIYEAHSNASKLWEALQKRMEDQRHNHTGRSIQWKCQFVPCGNEFVLIVWNTGAANVEIEDDATKKMRDLAQGYRYPVVATISQAGRTKFEEFTIAAWHAPGPGQGMAWNLWERLRRVAGIDIFIGDFNFESSPGIERGGDRKVAGPKLVNMTPDKVSSFTGGGPARTRQNAIDMIWVAATMRGRVKNIFFNRVTGYGQQFELTDHLPLAFQVE